MDSYDSSSDSDDDVFQHVSDPAQAHHDHDAMDDIIFVSDSEDCSSMIDNDVTFDHYSAASSTSHQSSQWVDANYDPKMGTQPFGACGLKDLMSKYAYSPKHTTKSVSSSSSSSPGVVPRRTKTPERPTGHMGPSSPATTRARKRVRLVDDDGSDVENDNLQSITESTSVRPPTTLTMSRNKKRKLARHASMDTDEDDTLMFAQVGWSAMVRAWNDFSQQWQLPHVTAHSSSSVRNVAAKSTWKHRLSMSHFELMWKMYCRYGRHEQGGHKAEYEIDKINYYDHMMLGLSLQYFFDGTIENESLQLLDTNDQNRHVDLADRLRQYIMGLM